MYLCVTNRHLCREPFLQRLERLSRQPEIEKIILREKDLSEEDYEKLAEACMAVCGRKLVLHTFVHAAARLGAEQIHLSMDGLRVYRKQIGDGGFRLIGASVHSVEEAVEAEGLGASYLTAGHIFATDCKKGVPPKGCGFLRQVCRAVEIPVYGIGGITPENLPLVLEAGAAGGCRMSGFMVCSPD